MTDLSRATTATGAGRPVLGRRQLRLPWLAAGAALVLVLALLLLWGFGRAADRVEVLMVDADIPAGTPITPDALSTTLVGADVDVIDGFVSPDADLSEVVAATDLSAGDVLARSMLRPTPSLPEGWREVGALVRLGRYPTLAVGDEVVAVPIDADGEVSVIVVATNQGEDRSLSVVLAAPPAEAADVAQWAATDRLALVRVP